jgi:PBP1b-binding outer membrane lipoprotein LpoB
MKRTVVILLLSGLLFAVGCSRPTAEAPAAAQATPTPQKSEEEVQKEQALKADSTEAHAMKAEPMNDKPIMAVSPSTPASTPKP